MFEEKKTIIYLLRESQFRMWRNALQAQVLERKLENKNPSHGKIVKILIPKPLDVDALISRIQKGKLVTDKQIRERLARDYDVDMTCAKVTGMFIHIASEAAEEDLRNGKNDISPYWRIIKKDGRLNPRLHGGVDAQSTRLREEGHTILPRKGEQAPQVEDFEKYLQEL